MSVGVTTDQKKNKQTQLKFKKFILFNDPKSWAHRSIQYSM